MAQISSTPTILPRLVRTVLGDIPYHTLGVTDAHNHVWIDSIPGVDPKAPVLNEYEKICSELKNFREAGGTAMLDCQPGGCGRNGKRLVQLSRESGVHIIACTGFHRRNYYPTDYWLFDAPQEKIALHFIRELEDSLEEMKGRSDPAPAGFIKLAFERTWAEIPQAALEGAAEAAHHTGVMIEIHTEKGILAEKAALYFEEKGIPTRQLVLCHMDKRPDFGLHSELARFGVLLEYDTFYRPKYDPETHLWTLILNMVEAGFENRIALATDMVELLDHQTGRGGPGLASLPGEIKSRLVASRISANAIQLMLGENIARRLAGLA